MADESNWNLNFLDFNGDSSCTKIYVSQDDVDKLNYNAQQGNEEEDN